MISILIMVAITALFFGVAMLGLSISLIIKKKPLTHNGCGSSIDENGDFTPCDSCSEQDELADKELHKALIDDNFRKTFGQFAKGT